ncbi:MAG: DUF4180 domain-containing protein [Synergistaceae bacterium]|jgi:hypothetical protein|nr:DUF4180 domain-containing protein [Synergistaceae bacterium]
MDMKIIDGIAIVNSKTPLITDARSALDFIASVGCENNVTKIAIHKAAVGEDFFRLSTGLAGDVAQKFVNYGFRLAVIGDFSGYTSKSLRDYMYECNKGRHLYFVKDEGEAIEKLGGIHNK